MVTKKVAKVATKKECIKCDDTQCHDDVIIGKKTLPLSHVGDFGDQKVAKVAKKFECINCNYNTSRKSNYEKHLLTNMHIKREYNILPIQNFNCDVCKKIYQSKNGLWIHKKKCKEVFHNQTVEINSLTNLVVEVVKQNQDFQKMIVEQNKQIVQLSRVSNIINHSTNITNNSFNINLFLNEKCKDALNINDFVHSLNLTLSDLENVGTSGFINGISHIFVKGLKELDIYKRPVHCSDLKRETIYIKGENSWEKENEEKEKIKKAIKDIANKNIQKITEWTNAHPSCKSNYSKTNDKYMKILNESMCSDTKEEENDKYNKIIKNIAKEVIIDKT
jgi:hypothetical protein